MSPHYLVLLLHGTGSDTTEFFESSFSGPLYGSGHTLDLSKFYLVIPDAIGHGKSSKPSEGLRGHFRISASLRRPIVPEYRST